MTTIYRLGSLGYFRGEAEAKKDGNGKDIIPSDVTTVKPPAAIEGFRRRFVDEAWIQEPVPQPTADDIQKADYEQKIAYEMRKLAIQSLIGKGQIPADYT